MASRERWSSLRRGRDGPGRLWAHSGRELFFFDGDLNLVAVEVETQPSFRVGERTTLFDASTAYLGFDQAEFYAVTSDDRRFLMARSVEGEEDSGDAPERRTILVKNWFEELKERLGG